MNTLHLSAVISESKPLRYTPAGVPALDLWLAHESTLEEAGGMRTVKVVLRALALGPVAERLSSQAVGTEWVFRGFLASWRGGKQVALHIQDFRPHS